MKKGVAAAAGLMMLWPLGALAQTDEQRATALAQCLLSNTTTLEQGLVKNLLVSALQEDVGPAGAYLRALLAQIETLATQRCSAPADFGAQPWAANVPTRYIDALIAQAIGNAMTTAIAQLQPAEPGAAPAPGATPAPAPVPPPAPFAPVPAPFTPVTP